MNQETMSNEDRLLGFELFCQVSAYRLGLGKSYFKQKYKNLIDCEISDGWVRAAKMIAVNGKLPKLSAEQLSDFRY